jgi:drug/metabolite transporter (DMT)-like permease
VAAFAAVDGALFQGCLAEGLRRTSAGLGSVVIDSQPLTVAALSALLYGERLTGAGLAGLAAGVGGLVLLEAPPDAVAAALPAPVAAWLGLPVPDPAALIDAASSASTSASSLWDSGAWWMLLAAQAMAVGTVMVPWVTRPSPDGGRAGVDPVMATGWHMVLGGVPLAVAAAVREGPDLAARLALATPSDVALLLYVSLLGSAASYAVFFYNASRGSLTSLSSLTFLTPAFAAATGYLFLGETLTPLQLTGAGVTLAAVALISTRGKAGKAQ